MELGNSKQEIDVPQKISDTDNMDNYNDDDTNVKLFQLPTEIIQHIVSYLSLQGMDKFFCTPTDICISSFVTLVLC